MMSRLRIVAMADTHLQHDDLVVPGGDILVHAGDMLQHGSLDELERAADYLRALPHPIKIIVAGNHDVCLERRPAEARALLSDFIYLEDEAATASGLVFYGSPWQPMWRVWAFGAPRGAELASKWAKIPERVDVLVTHGPPYGYGDRITWKGRQRHVGCADLRARVEAAPPRFHLFGHIHQDRGLWTSEATTFANVTTDEGAAPPTVIDLQA
jgi:Icc-related predicted phosphoesterase